MTQRMKMSRIYLAKTGTLTAVLAGAVICAVGAACSVTAFAAVETSVETSAETSAEVSAETDTYEAVDGNRISATQLMDNVIEYAELGSLIHANNESVKEITDSTERTRANYTYIRDYLYAERSSANRDKENAEESEDAEAYSEALSLSKIYSSAAKRYNDMIENLDKNSSQKTLRTTEKQLTSSAQSLMISWQAAVSEREYQAKLLELYRQQYEIAKTRNQAGLATDLDVQTAYGNWTSAQVSLSSLQNSEQDAYESLCTVTGMADGVQIQSIPAVDVQEISHLDLAADTAAAIGNNTNISAERNTSASGTTAKTEKSRTLAQLEASLQLEMQELYQAVMQAKTDYDAAQLEYSAAQLRFGNAGTKYQLGMLSSAEYLQEEISYTQTRMSAQSADLNLRQALESYRWAVQGITM